MIRFFSIVCFSDSQETFCRFFIGIETEKQGDKYIAKQPSCNVTTRRTSCYFECCSTSSEVFWSKFCWLFRIANRYWIIHYGEYFVNWLLVFSLECSFNVRALVVKVLHNRNHEGSSNSLSYIWIIFILNNYISNPDPILFTLKCNKLNRITLYSTLLCSI